MHTTATAGSTAGGRRPDLAGVAGPGTCICGAVVGCRSPALSPVSAYVTRGVAELRPPAAVRACRTARAPSFTRSGHGWPTDASRTRSGQMRRSQRTQRARHPAAGRRWQVVTADSESTGRLLGTGRTVSRWGGGEQNSECRWTGR
ncbi:hypothetical protein EZV63_08275 [Streptomyces sp. VN1]|nr:hypothetical protein EZV63_08275 [Streptomyces sp. VN1]